MESRGDAERSHRAAVGGMWHAIGQLQFEFLIRQGLRPEMCLLDVGCGSLRGGVHFVRYLEPGRYYGLDADAGLLEAGYEQELFQAGLQHKLPLDHLLVDSRFDFSRFPCQFDMAIAQSVFTHLPLNSIRLCLLRLAPRMKPGGRFFATFFECPASRSLEGEVIHDPGGIITFPDSDPFHYRVADLEWAAREGPWRVEYIGDWNHPRAQKMLAFERKS